MICWVFFGNIYTSHIFDLPVITSQADCGQDPLSDAALLPK